MISTRVVSRTLGAISLCAAGTLLVQGCGAMNPKPGDAAGTAASSARCASEVSDPGDGSTVSVSPNAHFVINARLANLAGDATKDSPKTGNLVIRGVHGATLQALSKDTVLTVTYAKESAHVATHDPYPLAVTFQADATGGTFTGPFSIPRSGTYDFVITLSDGGDQDVHTVTFKIQ